MYILLVMPEISFSLPLLGLSAWGRQLCHKQDALGNPSMSRNCITNTIYTEIILSIFLVLSVINTAIISNSRFLLGAEKGRRMENILWFKTTLEGLYFFVGEDRILSRDSELEEHPKGSQSQVYSLLDFGVSGLLGNSCSRMPCYNASIFR